MRCEGEGCGQPVDRREFLARSGTLALGAMAGPFRRQDFTACAPPDKRLSPEWLAQLTARGEPEWITGEALRHVGMPVGGIGCGQLYLGGDGRLWMWRIFAAGDRSDYGGTSRGVHYANPPLAASSLEQGFALEVEGETGRVRRRLDRESLADVRFRGEYPIGRVRHADPALPVEVDLEAFSPFVPLDAEDSGLPATVFCFRVRNPSRRPVRVRLAGWCEHGVCPGASGPGRRRVRVVRAPGRTALAMDAFDAPPPSDRPPREEIVFADFEGGDYGDWTVEGEAFGERPLRAEDLPSYHDVRDYVGEGFASSHQALHGEDVRAADGRVGVLRSPEFTIRRRYVNFRVCGGRHPGRTEVRLLVDGKIARRATGHDGNRMRAESFDVRELEGRRARLEVVDRARGAWGNIGLDHVVFADTPLVTRALERRPGFGSMALTVPAQRAVVALDLTAGASAEEIFAAFDRQDATEVRAAPLDERLIAGLAQEVTIPPGDEVELRFVLSWWFPYLDHVGGELARVTGIHARARRYAARFRSAEAVGRHVTKHQERLIGATRTWNRTWYDSTLPYWLLDRTFVTIDALATETCLWLDDGRFWGWEGVVCCPGTCQHVWQYAQAVARVFPALERDVRERIDLGLAWHPSGAIDYRAESGRRVAHDGLCGTVVRFWREHTMAPDRGFLERNWRKMKRTIEFLLAEDRDADGLLEGAQYNTLDATWYGPMGWISSLFLAALAAGAALAEEAGDAAFAARCRSRLRRGRERLVAELFDGEYFVHRPDPAHPEATNTNRGCHIDQVLGQSFAWQVGLGRVVPERECRSALRSLWRYNFTPDVGPYRRRIEKVLPGGRWYAMPGEAGLLMCTWPKGGADRAAGKGNPTFVGYFNECMTGFEYQVAAHMIFEGMVQEGLSIVRAIHERYGAERRNPFNEIECGDHYARAMMSYGVYVAICGFEAHGPRAHLGFAPKLRPERFRAAFVAPGGWGTFTQRLGAERFEAEIELRHGEQPLASLALELPEGRTAARSSLAVAGRRIEHRLESSGRRIVLRPARRVQLRPGERLSVRVDLD